MISVAISSHYFFGQDQRTAQLEGILRRFPTWAFPSSWVSTYDMYRYWGRPTSHGGLRCEETGAAGAPRDELNSTEDQPCRLFTVWHKHTNTLMLPPSPAWETPITVSVGLVANGAGRPLLRHAVGELSRRRLTHWPPQASCSPLSPWEEGVMILFLHLICRAFAFPHLPRHFLSSSFPPVLCLSRSCFLKE